MNGHSNASNNGRNVRLVEIKSKVSQSCARWLIKLPLLLPCLCLPLLSPALRPHSDHAALLTLFLSRLRLAQFDAEFRRFALNRSEVSKFDDFYKLLEKFHRLCNVPFHVFYTDPTHGDLLPINNDDNYAKAVSSARPLLRLVLQRKGEGWEALNGFGKKKKDFFGISNLVPSVIPSVSPNKNRLAISLPEDFRQVSQIIDVDILPGACTARKGVGCPTSGR